MAIVSKRKRMLLLVFLAASISNAFLVVPHVKIVSPEIRRSVAGSLQGRSAATGPLQAFWGKQAHTTTSVEKASPSSKSFPLLFQQDLFSIDSTGRTEESQKELTGGRFSLALAQADTLLRPAADALDDATDGWALTYADLSPETESTPVGQAFLASNIAYAAAGVALSVQGDLFLGLLTELVSVASFIYHYTQLDPKSQDDTVRLALFIDYVLAFSSIFVGLGYMLTDGQLPPIEGIISAALGMSFFMLGITVCAEGMPYVVVHSLWHVFSAYCAYSIGNTHLALMS